MKTLSDALQRAWYGGALWFWPLLVLLWPLSVLYTWLAARRRRRLQQHCQPPPVPVIVVGNITVGGTGKTPLLCALAQQLTARGLRAGIISRGYGGSHRSAPRLVSATDSAAVVGDEPLLLARTSACPVVIGRDRAAALATLLAAAEVDVVLSDDGLQHYALPRTVEIAVLDAARGLGNGLCLPAGPLREPASRLAEVDFVVTNGEPANIFRPDQWHAVLQPVAWVAVASGVLQPLQQFAEGTMVHALAGIGHPQRFFGTLRELGLQVIEHPFADHHAFTPADLQFADGLPVVMTEKDAVKCAPFAPANCHALRVQMVLPAGWLDALLARMNENYGRH